MRGLAASLALAGLAWALMPGPAAAASPVRLDLPQIGVSALVEPVGQDQQSGAMQAPSDPDQVGWLSLGPVVGQPGNAIFDGHVDWAGRLRVFGQLADLQLGDLITVSDATGAQLSYSVDSTQLVSVDDPGAAALMFAQPTDGSQAITLITCGGVFDHARHEYLGRLVVHAQRVS